MKSGTLLLLMGGLVSTAACMSFASASYNMSLREVQRPENVAERWGAFTLNKSADGYTYDDNLVHLLVVPAHGSFVVTIQNKTQHSMQFIWDQAAYVSPNGLSGPVSSGETRCIQMGQSRPPETIPAQAQTLLTVIPNNQISSSYRGGCHVRDFIPSDSTAMRMEGKEARLLLPLRVQDIINEYTLVFVVTDIALKTP